MKALARRPATTNPDLPGCEDRAVRPRNQRRIKGHVIHRYSPPGIPERLPRLKPRYEGFKSQRAWFHLSDRNGGRSGVGRSPGPSSWRSGAPSGGFPKRYTFSSRGRRPGNGLPA